MNPIDAIAERLDGGRLWLKGDLGKPEDPAAQVCLAGCQWSPGGSVNPIDTSRASRLICQVIRERYPDRVDLKGEFVQANFNDHPDTTWEDVALVLKNASSRWDES